MELFLQNAANYIYVRGVRVAFCFMIPSTANCIVVRALWGLITMPSLFVSFVASPFQRFALWGTTWPVIPLPINRMLVTVVSSRYWSPSRPSLVRGSWLRMLYLRHGLRLRVLLHRSKKPALVLFRELWARYFPGQPCIDYHGRTLIRSMGYALKSAANDGVLFVTGSEQDVGGPVTRETRPELARNFPTADRLMEVYAKCYEWVHWEVIMLRFGKSIYTMQCRESLFIFILCQNKAELFPCFLFKFHCIIQNYFPIRCSFIGFFFKNICMFSSNFVRLLKSIFLFFFFFFFFKSYKIFQIPFHVSSSFIRLFFLVS